jgi:nucleoside-diphosphate-sugar epimerase
MIIGNGDIASVLKDREDRVYFASGVSNSQEKRESEFDREMNLLLEQDRSRHTVYFSSLSVFYSDTRYAQHKIFMENVLKNYFKHYTIIRLGNITFGKNPNTILNFFRNKIKMGEELEIRDEYRYIIDKEEFLHWMDLIPIWNCQMNITGRRMKVSEIVEEIKQGKL